MKKLLFLIAIGFVFITCKNKEIIIPEFEIPETDRVIIIEEFTGVRCPNCPRGQRELESLQLRFPGKIVVVGAHSFFLANPLPDSKYDFRTLDAEFLNRYLGIAASKPSAVINRTTFDVEGVMGIFNGQVDTWAGVVEKELEEFTKLNLDQTLTYDANTRALQIHIEMTPKEDLANPLYLNIMITESEIEDPQEDNGVEIEEYEHNHVLRDIITEVEGGDKIADNLSKDQTLTQTYNFTLPPEDGLWREEHIDVVVFVTTDAGGERRALQASVKKVIE